MKMTRLLIAAVLLAGLGGAVWWSNKQEAAKQGKPAEDSAATPKIVALKESDIRQVEIDHRGGENTVVKRNDANQWQIVAPKTLAADQGSVGLLTTAAATISAERVVDPNVTDLATYGLAPAGSVGQINHRRRQNNYASGRRRYAQRLGLRQARRRSAALQHEQIHQGQPR